MIKETVIFADTDPGLLDAVERLMERYTLIKAQSASEALYHMYESNPAMLLTNARLNGADTLLGMVPYACPGIDVIVITRNDQERQWASDRGAKSLSERFLVNSCVYDRPPAMAAL